MIEPFPGAAAWFMMLWSDLSESERLWPVVPVDTEDLLW